VLRVDCFPRSARYRTSATSKEDRVSTAPTHREKYETHFRCPVKFKAKQNALLFNRSDMDLPFVTYNPDLLATVAPQLEAELTEQLAHKTF
jgi:Arabinose-binding domain of AraC transcription regulator, N-term